MILIRAETEKILSSTKEIRHFAGVNKRWGIFADNTIIFFLKCRLARDQPGDQLILKNASMVTKPITHHNFLQFHGATAMCQK